MATADIVIIGGGVAGLATAWHLAQDRPNADVVLIESNDQLAAESSGLNAAILRTLSADALESRFAARSARFLRTPPADFSNVPLIDERGLILCPEKGAQSGLVRDCERAGEDVAWQAVDAEDLHRLHPWMRSEAGEGVFFPRDGQIDIAALVAGFARGARAGGCEIRLRTPVLGPIVEHGRLRGVRLGDGTSLYADTVVLAAGGWAARWGRAAGSRVRLRPTRRHLMVTRPDASIDARWPVVWQLGASAFYARPESGGMLLCACDQTDVHPDRCPREGEVRELIAHKAARYLPELSDAAMGHYWCGMRTLTADGRFVVGPDADVPGLFWVAGLAGAGMVCGAEVGRLAASLLLESHAGGPGDEPFVDAFAADRPAILEVPPPA